MKEIYFGGGCFWGVQEYFNRQEGVVETLAGYAGGDYENPSYEDVCSWLTGHAEVVYVRFDEELIDYETILNKFWGIINPTLENRQGPDMGPQYRTAIYYTHKEDLELIEKTREEQREKWGKEIKTEIKKIDKFYRAEDYHQDYLRKNPRAFCHIDLDA